MPWTDRVPPTGHEQVEALIHREVAANCAEHPSDADGRPAYAINATVRVYEDDQLGAIVSLEIRVEDRLPVFLFGLRALSRLSALELDGLVPRERERDRPA